MNGASRGVARNASSSATDAASSLVEDGAPSIPSARSVSGTSAAPTAPVTASRSEPAPGREREAQREALLADRDRRETAVGRRETPAVAATPTSASRSAAGPRADRGAGLGLGRAIDARGGAPRSSQRARFGRRPVAAPPPEPDGRRGAARGGVGTRGVQRQRDEHGGGARPLVAVAPRIGYSRACPTSRTCGGIRTAELVTFGTSLPLALVSVHRRPERHRDRLGARHSRDVHGQAGAAAATSRAGARSCPRAIRACRLPPGRRIALVAAVKAIST